MQVRQEGTCLTTSSEGQRVLVVVYHPGRPDNKQSMEREITPVKWTVYRWSGALISLSMLQFLHLQKWGGP